MARKSLYRLVDENEPLERLELREAGAICKVCAVPLSDLIAFRKVQTKLHRLANGDQSRLTELMDKNNEGKPTRDERTELK